MRTGLVTVIFLALLLVGCVVYPGIGARFIAPQTVLQAFLHFDPQNFDHNVIVRLRLPRLAATLLPVLLLELLVLCCRLSFVTHWGATYFRLKCRSRSCCRCCQCAWAGLSGWTPTAGIYGRRVIVPVDIAAFLRRAFRVNANESYFMRRGAIGVRVLNNGCNPDS